MPPKMASSNNLNLNTLKESKEGYYILIMIYYFKNQKVSLLIQFLFP